MEFLNPLGFYSLIAVGILIFAYLIKPKPLDVKIPSVMFLMHEKGSKQKTTFFQKFIMNLLFLLQFLALLALAVSTTLPLISMTYDSTAENTIIVLDVSNSMNTKVTNQETRFEKAIKIAKNNVKGRVSIVLAETVPLLLLEDGSSSKAKEILNQLTPKHTTTNIGDAMTLAGDLLSSTGEQSDGRIIVISDFLWTDGADPEVIKKVLEAKGLVVDFVNLGKAKENVGFVNMDMTSKEVTAYVKNYGKAKVVSIDIQNENTEKQTLTRPLLENGMEPITFKTLGGITRLQVTDTDALMEDNILFISNPKKTKTKILIMTNKRNTFMENALNALEDAEVTVAEPPIVPDVRKENYEIIIFSEVEHEKLLPGTMKDIKKEIEEGTAFIVTYQNTLNQINFDGLLPIIPDIVHESTTVKTIIENQFTKDIDFGTTENYYKSRVDNSTLVLATASDEQESPIIAMKNFKQGKLVYYGIDDQKSSFKNSPGYPIFWNGLKNFLIGIADINQFNHQAGNVLSFEIEKTLETPNGRVKGKRVVLDTQGIYVIDGKQHAVNTVHEKESDTLSEIAASDAQKGSYTAKKVLRKRKVKLEPILLTLGVILIILELLYTKFRGDF